MGSPVVLVSSGETTFRHARTPHEWGTPCSTCIQWCNHLQTRKGHRTLAIQRFSNMVTRFFITGFYNRPSQSSRLGNYSMARPRCLWEIKLLTIHHAGPFTSFFHEGAGGCVIKMYLKRHSTNKVRRSYSNQ